MTNEDQKKKKGRGGTVAIIAAIFTGLSGLVSSGAGYVINSQKAAEVRAGSELYARQQYATLRDALVKEREKRFELSTRVSEMAGELRMLRKMMPRTTVSFAPRERIIPMVTLIEDPLADLPDLDYPEQAVVEEFMEQNEQDAEAAEPPPEED